MICLRFAWAEILTKNSWFIHVLRIWSEVIVKKKRIHFFLPIIEFKPFLFIYWFGQCPWRFNNFVLGIFSTFWMLLIQAYSVLFNLPPCVGAFACLISVLWALGACSRALYHRFGRLTRHDETGACEGDDSDLVDFKMIHFNTWCTSIPESWINSACNQIIISSLNHLLIT